MRSASQVSRTGSSGSWEGSFVEHRRRIREALDDSPSPQPYLESIFAGCYSQAVKQAKAE